MKLEAAVGQEATMPKQVVIALCSLAVACRVGFSMVALVAQNGTNAHHGNVQREVK